MSLGSSSATLWRHLQRQLPRAWRLAQVLGAMALIIWIGQRWLDQGREAHALLNSQADTMAQQLLQQSALGITLSLDAKPDERLDWLVANLVKDPQVVSATVFGRDGQQLAQAQSLFPEARLPDRAVMHHALNEFTPYSTQLFKDGEVAGYLRIRVNEALFFYQNRKLIEQQQQQQHQLLMLAALAGLVLARALSLKRAHYRALVAREVNGELPEPRQQHE